MVTFKKLVEIYLPSLPLSDSKTSESSINDAVNRSNFTATTDLYARDIHVLSKGERLKQKIKDSILLSPPESFRKVLDCLSLEINKSSEDFFVNNRQQMVKVITDFYKENGFVSIECVKKGHSISLKCTFNNKQYQFVYSSTIIQTSKTTKDAWLDIFVEAKFDVDFVMLKIEYPNIVDQKTYTYVCSRSLKDNNIRIIMEFPYQKLICYEEYINLDQVYDPKTGKFNTDKLKTFPTGKGETCAMCRRKDFTNPIYNLFSDELRI